MGREGDCSPPRPLEVNTGMKVLKGETLQDSSGCTSKSAGPSSVSHAGGFLAPSGGAMAFAASRLGAGIRAQRAAGFFSPKNGFLEK